MIKIAPFLIIFVLVSCSSNKLKTQNDKTRQINALVELSINEIANDEFSKRKILYKGNPDSEIDELEDFDQIISESVSELEAEDLAELGHVSEPITQAVIFCRQGKFESGKKILNALFSKYSKTSRFWNAKGLCSLRSGETKKAKYFFDYALGLGEYAPALNNLAILYYKAGNHQKAYMLLDSGVRKSKLNSMRYNLALVSYLKGFYKEAISILESILSKIKILIK